MLDIQFDKQSPFDEFENKKNATNKIFYGFLDEIKTLELVLSVQAVPQVSTLVPDLSTLYNFVQNDWTQVQNAGSAMFRILFSG